ncbi:MAG: sigma-70 family RNA polymerase sigma factor [Deltaproteobacteria bacterium]|nr:sigma-70 family RNA polymerase sigma factor [Deltaproteobacteria bacterium]
MRGNTEEFRHLVSTHKNRIFSMVLRTVGEHAVAEELTQEIFVRAYSSLAKFRFESSFSTWLTCIALNHTNSYFKSKKYKQKVRTVCFEPRVHDQSNEMESEIETDAAVLENFREALQELKPAFREIIVLCSLEGKSYEEVAGILAVPVGTVRSRLNRAREKLRLLIEQRCGAL